MILVAAALPACTPAAPVTDPVPERAQSFQILHTNDFHGRILPQVIGEDTLGGSAVLAAHFDSLRAQVDGPTFLLSGGDVMQGTAVSNLSWGRASIALYNEKGYDAAALGNHEFDWGLDTLRVRVAESEFVWLAANILEHPAGTRPDWIRPWVILEEGGLRVGVVGVALAMTPEIVMAGRTEGLEFLPEAPAIDEAVRELRAQGVDAVIVTGHVGAICEEPGEAPEELSSGCRGGLIEIVEAMTEPVDLFVGGHTHLRNLTDVAGIPIVQTPAYSGGISVTRFDVPARTGTEAGTPDRPTLVHRSIREPWARLVDPDTAVARMVEEWTVEIRPILEEPVATLARPFSNEERAPRENPAGNLLADAQRWATGADVGIVNNGSLRRSLPEGEVSWEILYEFQPFQNELVLLHMDGALLRDVLEFGLDAGGNPWTHISGAHVRYDPAAPQGERIREIRLEDGRVVAPDDRIRLGTTEFLATAGDGYELLLEADMERTGVVDVDGLRDYLATLPSPIQPPELGRWNPAGGG